MSLENDIAQAASSADSVGTDERLAQLTADAITAAGKDSIKAIHASVTKAMKVMEELNTSAKRLEQIVKSETDAHASKVKLAIKDFQSLIAAMKAQESNLNRPIASAEALGMAQASGTHGMKGLPS